MKNKVIFSLLNLIISHSIFAKFGSCGYADINGAIREIEKGKLFIVVNEGTKSQIILKTNKFMESKLIPYENKPVSIKAKINQMKDLYNGSISNLNSIELRVPNPLIGSEDTYIKIIKKFECQK